MDPSKNRPSARRLGIITLHAAALVVALVGCKSLDTVTGHDPLPSWNDSTSRDQIIAFVERVTDKGSADYVPPAERIAVFDNDGTLWAETPYYFQLQFAIDRVKALGGEHPEWRDSPALAAALDGDVDALLATGSKGIVEVIMASHAGMTTDEFDAAVRDWTRTARHPRFQRPYVELTYRPMVEVLEYLRANGFQTWIVSGGGIDLLRVVSEDLYGIPPEQVVGSTIETKFEMRGNTPTLVRLPEIDFVDDKEGKPVAIHRHIGRRPIAAFGNSDGDHQMLQWTAAGDGARLCVLVHHTDAEREAAYDRESHIGKLDAALDDAETHGWTVIDMKNDWRRMFR